MLRFVTMLAVVGLVTDVRPASGQEFKPDPGFTSLFNGKDLSGWQLQKFKNDDWNALEFTVHNGVATANVNGEDLTEKDVLELGFRDGKPTAKLNGSDVAATKIAVKVVNLATCHVNGEPYSPLNHPVPNHGGIGLQAETGKFEFRRIQIKHDLLRRAYERIDRGVVPRRHGSAADPEASGSVRQTLSGLFC
jgi:hypothetical protein